MNMPLTLHIAIHIFLSLAAGFIVWKIYKKPFLAFFFALLSGVAVDLDHFIDYFLAFGFHFRLDYFSQGYQFLKSEKVYVLFHAWEYVIILLIIFLFIKNKTGKAIFLSLALGLVFHLSADILIDAAPIKTYSIIYRAENNFEIEKLAYPEHWEKFKIERDSEFLLLQY